MWRGAFLDADSMRDILLVVLAVIAAIGLFALGSRVRYARLGMKRRDSGAGFENFRDELGSRVSAEVARIVYDHFFDITDKLLPVLASDDIGDIYFIYDEDLVDELQDLAVKCHAAAPTAEDALLVNTVQDAAVLMDSLRKEPGQNRPATATAGTMTGFRPDQATR